ncbi:DUF5709 domain-containing protein [Streptomyces radicis]|uniref:DUF5709 domain-containing protein n=1 Tax=Streptomyces radicis TaxID=1750517 RepID=A0A3A9WB69_9ACTN|nr:DUF5709 domain-containing protein [Streptomyces radicis]RKN03187.1 hypothetical protein D7319_32070 [Streptomyces radicis]RKN13088.1 hypothetical protein D7318_31955 [Streptomyces radicis]
MTDEPMGDDVYQPNDPTEDVTYEADLENALGEKDLDEVLDEGYSPPERPLAVNGPGTTAAEQRERESLDDRLAVELPDVGADDDPGDGIGDSPDQAGEPLGDEISGAERAGRLVGDEGEGPPRDADVTAYDVGIDGGAAAAEEAAMHIAQDEREERAEGFEP